jgi:beta-N-acetylhexosaminidase
MSDAELVGQLLMPYAYGGEADRVSAAARRANQRLGGVDTPAQLVRRYDLGGLILVRGDGGTSNIDSPRQLRKLTDGLQAAAAGERAGLPLLIGADQEHGVVTRVRDGVTLLPSAMAFGAAANPAMTEEASRVSGTELAAVGINVDFAPDADVTGGAPNAVIGSRSFGSAPAKVGAQVAAAVRGYERAGVATTLKHFPGHGHTATDSHRALPVLRRSQQQLLAEDIKPFADGIAAGASLVMTGHLEAPAVDPTAPATFSRRTLIDLLRRQLRFGGVVITDAMNMAAITNRYPPAEAAVQAVLAGNDIVLMPPDLPAAHAGLLAALRSGRLPRVRVVESAIRIVGLKQRLGTLKQPNLDTLASTPHRAAAAAGARAAVTVLRGACDRAVVRGPVRITGGTDSQRRNLTGALQRHGVVVRGDGGAQVINLIGYGDDARALRPASVTVALDTPYLLSSAPSPVLVAAYSGVPASMDAVGAVLAGKARAPGRAPVTVPGLPATACP